MTLARSRLPPRPHDQRIPRAPRPTPRSPIPGRLALKNPGRHPHPGHPHHRPRPRQRRRDREPRHRTRAARSTATPSSSPATGFPDSELARAADLEIDPNTRGPLIDTRQATSNPGVFAIGNLTHPVDTADVAALDGRAVAQHVLADSIRPSVSIPLGLGHEYCPANTSNGSPRESSTPPLNRLAAACLPGHESPSTSQPSPLPRTTTRRTPSPPMAGLPRARVPHPGIGDRESTTGARRGNYRPRLAQKRDPIVTSSAPRRWVRVRHGSSRTPCGIAGYATRLCWTL